jgi:hypothetical protein
MSRDIIDIVYRTVDFLARKAAANVLHVVKEPK